MRHPAGIGSHESKLLDLRAATLTTLKLASPDRHNWSIQAALGGFFVTQNSASNSAQLLIRFNRKGELEWAVLVVDPSAKAEFTNARGFYQVSVNGGLLELVYDNGGKIKLRVPLHKLPAIEGQPRPRR